MKAIELLQQEVTRLGLYEGNLPEYITQMVKSIPSNSIPERMKLALVMSELMTYCSEFRTPIKHWNGSMIPINAITFCIAKSGASKDSSARAIRKCFEDAYKSIDRVRGARAKIVTRKKIEKDGKPLSDTNLNDEKYATPVNPLFVATSTAEGFIQHLNDLDEVKLGSGYVKAGEFGQELISNPNMTDILQLISEVYDTGDKELKMIKDRKMLSKEVKAMPVNALFLGSQDNILYDKSVKSKFGIQFSTKLARRSTFIFCNEPIVSKEYNSVEEIVAEEMARDDDSVAARAEAVEYINRVHEKLDATLVDKQRCMEFTDSCRRLYTIYKRFCEEDAESISIQYPLTKLTRTHLHWKALKLAGALAMMDVNNTSYEIREEHLRAAIEFEEIVYPDIKKFEDEIAKDSYEMMVSYCHSYAINHQLELPLYLLKKLGFIEGKISKDTIPNLVTMVKSFDPDNIYMENDEGNGIIYQGVEFPNEIGVSFKQCSGSKEERARQCADGFVYKKCSFERLGNMLTKDIVYTPFEFKNGKRNGQNIVKGTKWVCLDVDHSDMMDFEVHDMLGDINHHICRTSDPNNPYKFRVLVQLKEYVDLPNESWIRFIEKLADRLQIQCDLLPRSQIFFAYSNGERQVLSEVQAEPLSVADLIEECRERKAKPKKLTKGEKEALIGNPMDTFLPAYQAYQGEGRRKMVWVVRYGKELGMTKEQVMDVLNDINNYWVVPMNDKDFGNIMKFCEKHFSEEEQC